MTIPVQFFQAAATIIPTLLVALAIGAKQGEKIAQGIVDKRHGKIFAVAAIMFIMGLVVAGEYSALIGIINGEGNGVQLALCYLAITICLLILAFEFLFPVIAHLSPGWSFWITIIFCLGILFFGQFFFTMYLK